MPRQHSASHSSSLVSSPSYSTPVQEFGRNMLNLAFNLQTIAEPTDPISPRFDEKQLPMQLQPEFDSFVNINEFPSNAQLFYLYFDLYNKPSEALREYLRQLFSVVAYDAYIVPEEQRYFTLKFFITCFLDHFLGSDSGFYNLVRITQYLSEFLQYTYLANVFSIALKVVPHIEYYLTYLALGNICGQAIFNLICNYLSTILSQKFVYFRYKEGDEELFCIYLICQLVMGDKDGQNVRIEAENFYRAQNDIGKVSLRCQQLLHTYILIEDE